ncbi:MAG: GtrA family protein [Gallionellaceae bacterium]|nr:GtrA family protein [Gallionellaceae bacterium]
MKDVARIAFLYTVFAALATGVNLGSQAVVIWLYGGRHAVELSILAGTASGLPVKYILEKRHIFGFRTENLAHDGRLFILYSGMGVFTTALFWGIEYAFHLAFGSDAMRYLGGVIGLTLGYVIKYRLDKRYVFVAPAPVRGT